MNNRTFYLQLRAVVLVDEWLTYWTLIAMWALGVPTAILLAAGALAIAGNGIGYYNLTIAEQTLVPDIGGGTLIRQRRSRRGRRGGRPKKDGTSLDR